MGIHIARVKSGGDGHCLRFDLVDSWVHGGSAWSTLWSKSSGQPNLLPGIRSDPLDHVRFERTEFGPLWLITRTHSYRQLGRGGCVRNLLRQPEDKRLRGTIALTRTTPKASTMISNAMSNP